MPTRGRHKIFIGMAAGVGKTYRALQDIRDRRKDGTDALIGILETHGRRETVAAADGLPVFPRLKIDYKGVQLGELDVQGLIARKPELVLIDELAHTNVPGALRPKRFMDVEALLNAGINVISTLNIQHLESLNDDVARLTKVRVRERVPDRIVLEANEVVIVDISPEALRERLKEGKIYASDKVDQALTSFFKLENLALLREIALRHTADVVEEEPLHPEEMFGRGVKEHIAVAVRAEKRDARLIRRGARVAQRLSADLDVVHIKQTPYSSLQLAALNELEVLAVEFGASFQVIEGQNIAESLISFLKREGITQTVVGESHRTRFQEIIKGSVIHEVMRHTKGIDFYVIADSD